MIKKFKVIRRIHRGINQVDFKVYERKLGFLWLHVITTKREDEANDAIYERLGGQGGNISSYDQEIASKGDYMDQYRLNYMEVSDAGCLYRSEVFSSSWQVLLYKWIYQHFEKQTKQNVTITVETIRLPEVKRRKK